MKLEVCVADAQSFGAAIAGGADRIELCSALETGGLTPLPGLLALAAAAPVPVYAMIRPRSGDFVYDAADLDLMRREIDAVRAAGLAGVVLGASRADGGLDEPALTQLVAQAAGLGIGLHRAFDLVPEVAAAVEVAVGLGFERLLTSGGAMTALAGAARIAQTHALARGRIAVMAGAGITPQNIAALLAATPVDEVHGTCSGPGVTSAAGAVRLGFATPRRRVTDAGVVAALKAMLPG